MIFSSHAFLLLFMPIVFIGFLILSKMKKSVWIKVWLTAASLFFYAQGSLSFMPWFLFTVVFNYAVGYFMMRYENNKIIKNLLFAIGLIENIGLLAYFKYMNFFLENVNRFAGTSFDLKNILLPLGISFFTFRFISFVNDVHKGTIKKISFLDFLVYAVFFPMLIVGPVVHFEPFASQLADKKTFQINKENMAKGLFLLSVGCAKKVLFADPLIALAQSFYKNPVPAGFFNGWFAVFAYTFAYYFDFSGYGDMAVGLGLFFNIRLPFNFRSPYKAKNFAEFWRRWNITVTQFLYNHIFKSIYRFGDRLGKLVLGIMVTFIVSGIWHGAGWHFIAWGFVNGIFVCISNIAILKNIKLPAFLSWILTFAGILLTRVLFDAQNTDQAVKVLKLLVDIRPLLQQPKTFLLSGLTYVKEHIFEVLLIILGAGICFWSKNSEELSEEFAKTQKGAVFAAVLLAFSLFMMGNVSDFLYFQF
jgi:alginate O-acetyltransferase complex protein AlgI